MRPAYGVTRDQPRCRDTGSCYQPLAFSQEPRGRGIGAVIPRRSTEPPQPTFDRATYRERNRVERLFNRLKQHRAIATRYDKLAAHYAALLVLASILLWLWLAGAS